MCELSFPEFFNKRSLCLLYIFLFRFFLIEEFLFAFEELIDVKVTIQKRIVLDGGVTSHNNVMSRMLM